METLRAHSSDAKVNGEPVASPHLPQKMRVVFEIHRARSTPEVVGIAQPHSRIEYVTGVIEHRDIIPDVHMLIAIRPFGARHRLVAGRPQFFNLFPSEMRWLHGFTIPSQFSFTTTQWLYETLSK
jgi:hypothetical protein